MTELDKFQPEGEPIHPYDVYELLNSLPNMTDVLLHSSKESPACVDEADYARNAHKLGSTMEIAGKKYFQTTSVPPKTTRIF